MIDRPKYTFCLAAWKTAFLKEMIESILNQSYTDFRLVISDDCSPEDVKGVVNLFNDKRISYIRNPKNIGGYHLVDHWNLQLQRDANSDYVIMASDDDVYHKDFLKNIDELTIKHPQVDMLRARCKNTDAEGVVNFVDDPSDELQNELHFAADLYNGRHIRSFANFVFKTKTLKERGGFIFFPYAWYSDAVTTLMMAQNGVAHTLLPLFSYRGSSLAISGNITNKSVIRGKMEATLMYYEWMNNYIKKLQYINNPLNSHYINEVIKNFNHDAYATILSYFGAHTISEKISIYKKIKQSPFFSKASFCKELTFFYLGQII